MTSEFTVDFFAPSDKVNAVGNSMPVISWQNFQATYTLSGPDSGGLRPPTAPESGGGWIPLTEYFNVEYSLVEIAFPMNEKFWSEVGYFRILNLDIFAENG